MYLKKINETPKFFLFGNLYRMLLPRDLTRNSEVAMVRISPGKRTPPHFHEKEEQVYIIQEGKGRIRIEEEEREVEKGMIVYIPPGAEHEITATGKEDLVYIYIAIWLEGIPPQEKEWKRAYKVEENPL